MIKDMTKGNETRLLVLFALPLLAGNVFQQMYNMVDSVVVGRFIGADAFAAVGTSFPVMFLIAAVIMGLSMGAAVLLSQLYGARRYQELRAALSTCFLFLIAAALLLGLLGLLMSKPLLLLLRTPESILPEALIYLRIIFAGSIFMALYNILAAFLRALGDSRTPLYFLVITSLLNVVLDLIFVINFRMGVAGVAYATVLSQMVSSLLCVVYIYKKDIRLLKFTLRELTFDQNIFKKALRLGIPSSGQQTLLSIGFLAVQGLVNSFGTVTMAAFFSASRIEQLITMPNMSLGMAISTFTGQNMGAGRVDRVKKGYRNTLIIMLAMTVVSSIGVYLFGSDLIRLFLSNADEPVLQEGSAYLKTVAGFMFLFGAMFITNSLLRGAGDVNISMLSTAVVFAVRLTAAYALVPALGPASIWWSLPIGWSVGLGIAMFRYFNGKWKQKVLTAREHSAEDYMTDATAEDAM